MVVADRVTGKDPRRQTRLRALAVVVSSAVGAILGVSMALKLVWNMFAWELGNLTWSSTLNAGS